LDWHEDVPGLSADVVVGSDICYDPEAVPSLVRLLGQLLQPAAGETQLAAAAADGHGEESECAPTRMWYAAAPAPAAYIATTIRQDSTLQLFLDSCSAAGLTVEEVPKDPAAWVARDPVPGWVPENASAGCDSCCEGEGPLPAVFFQELPALQEGKGRERYVLHKVSNAECSTFAAVHLCDA
jgi:hypothetical protein